MTKKSKESLQILEDGASGVQVGTGGSLCKNLRIHVRTTTIL